MDADFSWIAFYEEFADKLREYRSNRAPLLDIVFDLPKEYINHYVNDQYKNGGSGRIRDICPFTTMGVLNRKFTEENRRLIAEKLAKGLNISASTPLSFSGVPIVPNQNACFFDRETKRTAKDIDILWEIFDQGLTLADNANDKGFVTQEFIEAFNAALKVNKVGGPKLTMGLFWARPEYFLPLDGKTKNHLKQHLDLDIDVKKITSEQYLEIMDNLRDRFSQPDSEIKSFPKLSLLAYQESNQNKNKNEKGQQKKQDKKKRDPKASVANANHDGGIDKNKHGKNLILYGPPGTGKTYQTVDKAIEIIDPKFYKKNEKNRESLMGRYKKLWESKKIGVVVFHQSFSYEEFVEGLAPEVKTNGQLNYKVKDGIFKELCTTAAAEPNSNVVLIIDEINRGNVAKIFGELITLIEEDKREGQKEERSVTLPYSQEEFKVPGNLFIIGTMNTADRSLVSIDIALRRRFEFDRKDPDPSLLKDVEIKKVNVGKLLEAMNKRILSLLGKDYLIGHSYFMKLKEESSLKQLKEIFIKRILPLLEEYFFDDWSKIQKVLGEDGDQISGERILLCPDEEDGSEPSNLVWEINPKALDNPQTYKNIYGEVTEPQ